MYRDLMRSLWLSVLRNGFFQTVRFVFNYILFKKCKETYYTFFCQPLNHAVSLRPGTSDFSVFRQLIMNGEYDMPLPIKPHVIIDAGANIGLASLYFHGRFPQAIIYAIEPDPLNYQALQNQAGDITAIKSFPLALWKQKEILSLRSAEADAWGIQVEAGKSNGNVMGMDLASFMQEQKIEQIDLLKIDIEGTEVELFQTAYEYWLERTRVIVIELHENLRPGCEKIFYEAIKVIPHSIDRSGENIVIVNLALV
jgi:FkbM family methyltransferase